MIDYRFPEEKDVVLFFTEKLKNKQIEEIILRESIKNGDEARALSKFFWEMADLSGACKKQGRPLDLPFEGGSEYWLEQIYNTLAAFLIESGYEDIWDDEVDKA